MNLTSKRMLQFMTVCAGACALSASAASPVTDSFEDNGPAGTVPNSYNTGWSAPVAGDDSALTNGDASVSGYTGGRPMTGVTSNLYLNLATGNNTLSRDVGGPLSFETASQWVDTLIQFIPSTDEPVLTGTNKLAVYVNANSNLVVRHCDIGNAVINSEVIGTISPGTWHRLTIELGVPAGIGMAASQISLDGVVITHANAYTTPAAELGGSWFLNLTSNFGLNGVAFKGTGGVDELVVTDVNPLVVDPMAVTLTLLYGSAVNARAWGADNGGKTDQELVDNVGSWLDDYLMNVAPDTNPVLVIDSITIGGGFADIGITTSNQVVTALGGIYGTMKYYTRTNLVTGSWSPSTGTVVNVAGAGTVVTQQVPVAVDNVDFIKATVE
ncbi:MAG: hypothetical protein WCK89_15435 [bacterium]